MKQPIAVVSANDLQRIIDRDFSSDQKNAVIKSLERYGTEMWHREVFRVRAATLKISKGSLERLDDSIEMACRDFRDVLSAAEYPRYLALWSSSDEDARQSAIDEDWREYQNWLRRAD